MFIDDPNTPSTDDTAPDPASAAVAAEPTLTPEPEADEGAAMLAAIAAEEAPKPEAAEAEPKPEAAKPDDAAKPEVVDPDAEITAEADKYGLKGKANERFREMAGEIKQMAPIREALEKAGITDVAELPQLVTRAKDGQDLMDMVQATGATPDQFSMTLDYTTAINAAMAGDDAAGERAWAMFMAEGASLAKALGKEFAGVHDPLTDHADLQADVEAGDLTRARALELAAVRQREATRTVAEANRNQAKTQTDAQTKLAAAEAHARTELNALGDELNAADPHFQSKLPQLVAFRDLVRKAHPPEQWAGELRKLYATIPAPVAAAPKLPTPGPVRGNGLMPTLAPTTSDPNEAMWQGITAATR